MKKIFTLAALVSICTLSAFAATYKVNSNGTLKSPAGTVQKINTQSVQQPVFNTVSSQNYSTNVRTYVGQPDIVEIIMDYSNSMTDWVTEARRVMTTVLSQIPSSIKVGLRVTGYGDIKKSTIAKADTGSVYKVRKTSIKQNYSNSCQSTKQIISIGNKTEDAAAALDSVTLGGATPLVYAMSQAISKDFAAYTTNLKKKIILITDGGENCGGNPCAFAQAIGAARNDIVIDVVLVNPIYASTYSCVANATGGQLYTPNQTYNLSNIIINSSTGNSGQAGNSGAPAATPAVQQQTQNYEFIQGY